MPQKSNEWDPSQRAASPVPQDRDDELETADDDEDFDEDDVEEEEGENAEDVGEE